MIPKKDGFRIMTKKEAEDRIKNAGLRVTPQRVAVLLALDSSIHPAAEELIRKVRKKYSNISSGSIYNILDTFLDKGIITRVYIPGDVMRYDAVLKKHHHLLDRNTNRVEDYFDDELFEIVENHLAKKQIPGFETEDIKIKLTGRFTEKPK